MPTFRVQLISALLIPFLTANSVLSADFAGLGSSSFRSTSVSSLVFQQQAFVEPIVHVLCYLNPSKSIKNKKFLWLQREAIAQMPTGFMRLSSGAALHERSVLAELKKFGVTVEYHGAMPAHVDPSDLPDAPWVMHEIRPVVHAPIRESIDELPRLTLVFPLRTLPSLSRIEPGENSEDVHLGFVNGISYPVAIKVFHQGTGMAAIIRELVMAQVQDRLGINPKFYGVIALSDGQMAYVMQAVAGTEAGFKAIRLRIQTFPDAQADYREILARNDIAGIYVSSLILTPGGHVISIDAGNAFDKNIDTLGAFLRLNNNTPLVGIVSSGDANRSLLKILKGDNPSRQKEEALEIIRKGAPEEETYFVLPVLQAVWKFLTQSSDAEVLFFLASDLAFLAPLGGDSTILKVLEAAKASILDAHPFVINTAHVMAVLAETEKFDFRHYERPLKDAEITLLIKLMEQEAGFGALGIRKALRKLYLEGALKEGWRKNGKEVLAEGLAQSIIPHERFNKEGMAALGLIAVSRTEHPSVEPVNPPAWVGLRQSTLRKIFLSYNDLLTYTLFNLNGGARYRWKNESSQVMAEHDRLFQTIVEELKKIQPSSLHLPDEKILSYLEDVAALASDVFRQARPLYSRTLNSENRQTLADAMESASAYVQTIAWATDPSVHSVSIAETYNTLSQAVFTDHYPRRMILSHLQLMLPSDIHFDGPHDQFTTLMLSLLAPFKDQMMQDDAAARTPSTEKKPDQKSAIFVLIPSVTEQMDTRGDRFVTFTLQANREIKSLIHLDPEIIRLARSHGGVLHMLHSRYGANLSGFELRLPVSRVAKSSVRKKPTDVRLAQAS